MSVFDAVSSITQERYLTSVISVKFLQNGDLNHPLREAVSHPRHRLNRLNSSPEMTVCEAPLLAMSLLVRVSPASIQPPFSLYSTAQEGGDSPDLALALMVPGRISPWQGPKGQRLGRRAAPCLAENQLFQTLGLDKILMPHTPNPPQTVVRLEGSSSQGFPKCLSFLFPGTCFALQPMVSVSKAVSL